MKKGLLDILTENGLFHNKESKDFLVDEIKTTMAEFPSFYDLKTGEATVNICDCEYKTLSMLHHFDTAVLFNEYYVDFTNKYGNLPNLWYDFSNYCDSDPAMNSYMQTLIQLCFGSFIGLNCPEVINTKILSKMHLFTFLHIYYVATCITIFKVNQLVDNYLKRDSEGEPSMDLFNMLSNSVN